LHVTLRLKRGQIACECRGPESIAARLPAGTRLISKNLISRENVSLFLRDAVGSQVSR
jgi:hypothetical protein